MHGGKNFLCIANIVMLSLLLGWAVNTRAAADDESLQFQEFTDGNALCNDYTRAGYFIRRTNYSTDWVIFFESGGACYSAATCNRRYLRREVRQNFGGGLITDDFDLPRAWKQVKGRPKRSVVSPLMTSIGSLQDENDPSNTRFDRIKGYDLLSTDCQTNPDFCRHNHVIVPYCSSDLWLGNDTRSTDNLPFEFDPSARNLQFIFRGFVIFHSLFKELFKPQNFTGNILLAGSSAGGIGVINHVKWVRDYLPKAVLRVFTESSWFVNFHDNIYQRFTDFVNISEDSRASNFDITEYVEEQNETTLLSIILHHEPCHSIELGTLCCISVHCLISNPDYYPTDVPILVAFSIYDVYLLVPSLRGIEPFNAQETSFEVHFSSQGKDSEPVGFNLDFIWIIGEYGGVMNSTLGTTLHQADHMSYFVSSCFQHIYLATSSLWDEGGLFGSDSFEVTGDDGVARLRHTVESGRWNKFRLTGGRHSNTSGLSLREAVGYWMNNANETHPVQFRDTCYTAHCNELCPEEIDLQLDDSYLWEDSVEILVYCIVATVTLVCFILKGLFILWHWWLLHNQKLFLERKNVGVGISFQFPECTEKISIACLNLRYSVPFSHKKYKETKNYDINPIILPVFHEESEEVQADVGSDGNHGDNATDVGNKRASSTGSDGDVVLTAYNRIDSRESESSGNGFVSSALPLLSSGATQQDDTVFHESVAQVFSNMISNNDAASKKKPKKVVEKTKTILKGISLYFNPGQLVAIMGPSGSGKTTFLDLLTGRRKYGNIEGEIYVNGGKLDDVRDWYVTNSGYVLQLAMPYYEELTVRENLTLAAQMRLSSSYRMSQKFERVEQVMYQTGLQSKADTVVGAAVGAGLSGGQKKRLTIAQQLLRLPSVLYLDEPTSGLDSASSYELLMYLNKLAGSHRTVIMTIHQPRMEIFHMFNRLIMLCEGQVAYHGTPAKAYEVFITALKAQYLEKGLALPELEDQNPADVIMDMLGNAKMREAILRYYQESGDPETVYKAIKEYQDMEEDVTDSHAGGIFHPFRRKGVIQEQGSFIDRISSLEARASLRSSKGQLAYLPVIFFLYGFLLGTVYIQTTSPLLIVSGFCVYSVASALFMFPIMHTYYSQALTLYHLEHSDGIGSASDLVIQGFSRFVFLGLIPVTLCAGILYVLVIQVSSYSLTVYLQVLVVNMALNQTWIALLIFVLCGFPTIAFRLSPVISSVAGFTSGFFIPRESMPPWYRWLFYINPNYYGFSSTSYLLLTNFDSNCAGNELECYVTSGEYTLIQFNFEDTNPALHVVVLLAMTAAYLLLAVIALWIRHTDFKPAYRKLQSWLFRSKDTASDFDMWTRSQTPNGDFFDNHSESDHQLENYEMTEFDENEELCADYDEVDAVSETCFENPNAIELEISRNSQDTITSTQSAPGAVNIEKPLRRPSLPTVEELSEDPLPPKHNLDDLNEPHKSLEQLLTPDSPRSLGTSGKTKATISSSSLPVGGVATMRQTDVPDASGVTRNPPPLLHTSTDPVLMNPTASDNTFDRRTVPSHLPAANTKKRKGSTLNHRKTQQEFSSVTVTRRPKRLSLRRGSSRFQSKFLDDNEDHVIWKPNKSPHDVTATNEQLKKKISTSSLTPATDYNVAKSKSWDHPDGDTISPISEHSLTTFSDFRLRQQQLLERVNVAREVAKDQNNTLYLPEVSEDDKKRRLKLASRYVSYKISKKPSGMGDVVFQAMAERKSASPTVNSKPLTPRERWQKAASSIDQHTPVMNRPSMTSLKSNQSELQLVKIHTLGQRPHKPVDSNISGMKSLSEQDLSQIAKDSPPAKSKPVLRTRATAMGLTTGGLENVDEDDAEKEAAVDLLPAADVIDNVNTNNACNENEGTAESMVITIDNLNSNNNCNNANNFSPTVNDMPEGRGWSGSIHGYDNPIKRFSQLYLPGSSSTMADSTSSLQEMDQTDTHPAIVLSKVKSSSTKDLHSAAAVEEGQVPNVQLRQSRSYGSLLRPVSLDKFIRVPAGYQFQEETDTTLQSHPKPTASSMGSPDVQSLKVPLSPITEPDCLSSKESSVTSSQAIVSSSAVVPHVPQATDHDDQLAASSHTLLLPSHEQNDYVTSTSLYAGCQEHRHGDKNPISSNVFQ